MRPKFQAIFQFRALLIIVVSIITVFGGPQVMAQSPEDLVQMRRLLETSPWPPCNKFNENVSEDEWLLLRNNMRNGFTVAHLKVIDSLRVEFVDNAEQLAPVLVPAGIGEAAGTLRIPRRFLRNICTIIRFNIAAQASNELSRNTAVDRLQNCQTSPARATSCVLETMSAPEFTEPVFSNVSDADIPSAFIFSFALRLTTLQTAQYILAHEVGHAVIRSQNNPEQLAKIDEEFEADLLAQLAVIDREIVPLGPLSILNAQAWIEGDVAPQYGLHKPAVCRRGQVQQIFLPMLRKAAALRVSRESKDGTFDFIASDSFAEGLASLMPLRLLPSNIQCDTAIPDRAMAVLADIERLDRTVRLVSAGKLSSDNVASQIRNQSMTTPEGRRLALASAVNLQLNSSQNLQIIRQIQGVSTSSPIDESLKIRLLDHLKNTDALINAEQREIHRPGELAMMMQFSAMIRYLSKPPGTSILTASREFISDFESSFVYGDPDSSIRVTATGLKLFPEVRSASGNAVFESVALYIPWMAAHIINGDCRPFSSLSQLAENQSPPKIDCDKLRQTTISEQQNRMGWVWDGQPLDDVPVQ